MTLAVVLEHGEEIAILETFTDPSDKGAMEHRWGACEWPWLQSDPKWAARSALKKSLRATLSGPARVRVYDLVGEGWALPCNSPSGALQALSGPLS